MADFLKIVVYNNAADRATPSYINNMASTMFRDVPKDEVLSLHNHWLGYGEEASLDKLPTTGLSADYVRRETKRAVSGVQRPMPHLPGDRHRHADRGRIEEDVA